MYFNLRYIYLLNTEVIFSFKKKLILRTSSYSFYRCLIPCLPLSIMATGGPIMNGDIPRSPSQPGTLEETLQQMNILIQENRDLKGKSRFVVVGAEEDVF